MVTLLDLGFLQRDQTVFGRMDNQLSVVLRFHHARITGSVFQGHNRGLETGRDVLVREKNRFQDVLARLPLADASQLRTYVAAFTINLVTTQTGRVLPLDERLPALFRVAA